MKHIAIKPIQEIKNIFSKHAFSVMLSNRKKVNTLINTSKMTPSYTKGILSPTSVCSTLTRNSIKCTWAADFSFLRYYTALHQGSHTLKGRNIRC